MGLSNKNIDEIREPALYIKIIPLKSLGNIFKIFSYIIIDSNMNTEV